MVKKSKMQKIEFVVSKENYKKAKKYVFVFFITLFLIISILFLMSSIYNSIPDCKFACEIKQIKQKAQNINFTTNESLITICLLESSFTESFCKKELLNLMNN